MGNDGLGEFLNKQYQDRCDTRLYWQREISKPAAVYAVEMCCRLVEKAEDIASADEKEQIKLALVELLFCVMTPTQILQEYKRRTAGLSRPMAVHEQYALGLILDGKWTHAVPGKPV